MGKKTGNPKGRPRIELDFDEFEKLCHFQCTEEEIAVWFGCTVPTIKDRVAEHYAFEDEEGEVIRPTFLQVAEGLRGKGLIGIKRKQFQRALGGSDKMLIHLGKQYLHQSDKRELSGPGGGPIITDDLSGFTNEELEERIAIIDRMEESEGNA